MRKKSVSVKPDFSFSFTQLSLPDKSNETRTCQIRQNCYYLAIPFKLIYSLQNGGKKWFSISSGTLIVLLKIFTNRASVQTLECGSQHRSMQETLPCIREAATGLPAGVDSQEDREHLSNCSKAKNTAFGREKKGGQELSS